MLSVESVTKRKPGRPAKDKPLHIPSLAELNLTEQSREKQADSIRQQAYTISRLLGRDILIALRDNNKTGIKDSVICYGIASDKVLSGVESSGIDLHVPAALMDKFALAINLKQTAPSVRTIPTPDIDIPQLP